MMNSYMKRYKEQGVEASQAQELLLPWSWTLPSWHMDAFTNLKLLEPLHLGFLWRFLYEGMVG